MKCFYHKSDLDGHCSGAIVKYFNPNCELIGVDYKNTVDFTTIIPGETVFVVDFSFSREDMEKLNQITDLIWIDHHKSSIEKCEGLKIRGLREIKSAACELTWLYCSSTNNGQIPVAVRLLGRYDVWDHEDPDVLPFQYGVRQHPDTRPENSMDMWVELISYHSPHCLQRLIEDGRLILKYQRKQDDLFAKGMFYETEFHGLRAIVMNKPYSNSKAFDSVYDPEKHDIMVLFGVKPGEVKYTLFCDKPEFDVSKIAVQYGGGGHRGAAGFYTETTII